MLADISVNPLDWITDATGLVVGEVAGSILDSIVVWVEEALAYVARSVASMITEAAAPNVGTAVFTELGGTFKWLALVSVAATVMLSCVGALLSRRAELGDVVREIPVTMVMLASWYSVAALWFGMCRTLTATFVADGLLASFSNGLALDPGVASFLRLLVSLLMIVFLLVFLVEMFVLQHLMTIATVVGPLAIALRPWPGLRDVASRMVRNVAAMSLTPALAAAAMSLAVRSADEAGSLDLGHAIGALAGMAVAVLMPMMVTRFLPLGGTPDAGGRAVMSAAVAAGTSVATVAAGGAFGASAGTAAGGTTAAGLSGSASVQPGPVAGRLPGAL